MEIPALSPCTTGFKRRKLYCDADDWRRLITKYESPRRPYLDYNDAPKMFINGCVAMETKINKKNRCKLSEDFLLFLSMVCFVTIMLITISVTISVIDQVGYPEAFNDEKTGCASFFIVMVIVGIVPLVTRLMFIMRAAKKKLNLLDKEQKIKHDYEEAAKRCHAY